MNITLPDFNALINNILPVVAEYNNRSQRISIWVGEHRSKIDENNKLLESNTKHNSIKVLNIFITDLLMRAIRGEVGEKLKNSLDRNIVCLGDLTVPNYRKILDDCNYRWKDDGIKLIEDVVEYFGQELHWDWKLYFSHARENYKTNFQEDKLLKIKNLKYKVRDLALSNFVEYYCANDLHVVRVATRIGLLVYGYDLLKDTSLEMGNNPSNSKNYLFLHGLFLKLSCFTSGQYSPVDIDRIFWHFGRTICHHTPQCDMCPINHLCLTGISRKS